MKEILINLNDKLINMCDVRNVTKQSIGFFCYPLFLSLLAGIEQKFMRMFKQAVM